MNIPSPDTAALTGRFRAAAATFAGWLDRLDADHAALALRPEPPAPFARFQQDWFPRLDAAIAYTIVRAHAPPLLIEIGAGHSSRWFAAAIADGGFACRQIAIDPQPRAPLPTTVERRAVPVQAIELRLFAGLGPGCVLSLDGSHRCTPGNDVDTVFNRILPALPAGILLHVHDVFLPDDYPAAWRHRHYDEHSAVAPLLTGADWTLLWSSHWVATRMADRLARSVAARLPLLPQAFESSLWLISA